MCTAIRLGHVQHFSNKVIGARDQIPHLNLIEVYTCRISSGYSGDNDRYNEPNRNKLTNYIVSNLQ